MDTIAVEVEWEPGERPTHDHPGSSGHWLRQVQVYTCPCRYTLSPLDCNAVEAEAIQAAEAEWKEQAP